MKIVITAGQNPKNYIAALESVGLDAHTILITEEFSWHDAGALSREMAASHKALLLPGGGDMHPALYGQELTRSKNISLSRDKLELCLLEAFLALGKPVLGICRGLQVINVYFGGTLIQHIDGHSQIDDEDSLHTVQWSGRTVEVNSAHHQVIDNLGKGLNATAASSDGVIEAISHDSLPLLAFQWHPERHTPTNGIVFSEFEYLCKNA